MKNVHSIDYVLDALTVLADNPYSLLWEITEDFKFNDHTISIKNSHQFKQAIIDGVYQYIGGNTTIVYDGKNYKPIEYVKALLTDSLYNESIDFGSGSEKEIREAIAKKIDSVKLNESETIRIYNSSEPEYKNLEIAATLLSAMTGKKYFVKDTYFDYGQDWKWTTICSGDVQYLSPRDHENIIFASNAEEIGKAVDAILNKKY